MIPDFIYEIPTLPTEAIDEDRIDLDKLEKVNKKIKFEKIPDKVIFYGHRIIIKENIGTNRIPIHLTKETFSFQHKIIGFCFARKNSIFLPN